MNTASWTNALEERFEHLAIPHITRGIVVLNLLVFCLYQISPEFIYLLTLDPEAIMRGEVWRLFTYLFIPDLQSGFFIIFVFFYLILTWFVGEALEDDWGPFKLNLYIFVGMISLTIVAFVFEGQVPHASLYSSLLLAFGTVYPKHELMLFPFPFAIQARYLSMFIGGLMFFYFLITPQLRLVIPASIANYALFFIPPAIESWKQRRKSQKRLAAFRGEDDQKKSPRKSRGR